MPGAEAHPHLLILLALLRREDALDLRVRRFELAMHLRTRRAGDVFDARVMPANDILDLRALIVGEVETPVEHFDHRSRGHARKHRRMPHAPDVLRKDAGEHAGDERDDRVHGPPLVVRAGEAEAADPETVVLEQQRELREVPLPDVGAVVGRTGVVEAAGEVPLRRRQDEQRRVRQGRPQRGQEVLGMDEVLDDVGADDDRPPEVARRDGQPVRAVEIAVEPGAPRVVLTAVVEVRADVDADRLETVRAGQQLRRPAAADVHEGGGAQRPGGGGGLTRVLRGGRVFERAAVNVSAAALVTILAQRLGGQGAVLAGTFILTVVVLIFGEVAPKTIGALNPARVALP